VGCSGVKEREEGRVRIVTGRTNKSGGERYAVDKGKRARDKDAKLNSQHT
jgi:hypothetical protein